MESATKKAEEGVKRIVERMKEMEKRNALAQEERHLRRLARQQAAERQARAKEFASEEFEERVKEQQAMIANRNRAQTRLRELRSASAKQFDIERKKMKDDALREL